MACCLHQTKLMSAHDSLSIVAVKKLGNVGNLWLLSGKLSASMCWTNHQTLHLLSAIFMHVVCSAKPPTPSRVINRALEVVSPEKQVML